MSGLAAVAAASADRLCHRTASLVRALDSARMRAIRRPSSMPSMPSSFEDVFGLRGHEGYERSGSTAEVKQVTAVGGDDLFVAGAEAEEVAEFIMAAAEAPGGAENL